MGKFRHILTVRCPAFHSGKVLTFHVLSNKNTASDAVVISTFRFK